MRLYTSSLHDHGGSLELFGAEEGLLVADWELRGSQSGGSRAAVTDSNSWTGWDSQPRLLAVNKIVAVAEQNRAGRPCYVMGKGGVVAEVLGDGHCRRWVELVATEWVEAAA